MLSFVIVLCLVSKYFGQENFLNDDIEYYSIAYSDFWSNNRNLTYFEPFKYTLGIKI